MIKTSDLIWQDTQHQMLFQIIDEIKREPFDRSVFSRLQAYAEQHFLLEEAYMTELEYPDIDAHIHAHDRFREELEGMIQSPLAINRALQDSLSLFLCEWLKLHVMGIDKKLEAFILESKAK
ncbi:MAG: hemerythrin family protein [Gammaproteobacteria bacterium]|nr:hemerythrin family protein [Gammaproteobacteria bacterium]